MTVQFDCVDEEHELQFDDSSANLNSEYGGHPSTPSDAEPDPRSAAYRKKQIQQEKERLHLSEQAIDIEQLEERIKLKESNLSDLEAEKTEAQIKLSDITAQQSQATHDFNLTNAEWEHKDGTHQSLLKQARISQNAADFVVAARAEIETARLKPALLELGVTLVDLELSIEIGHSDYQAKVMEVEDMQAAIGILEAELSDAWADYHAAQKRWENKWLTKDEEFKWLTKDEGKENFIANITESRLFPDDEDLHSANLPKSLEMDAELSVAKHRYLSEVQYNKILQGVAMVLDGKYAALKSKVFTMKETAMGKKMRLLDTDFRQYQLAFEFSTNESSVLRTKLKVLKQKLAETELKNQTLAREKSTCHKAQHTVEQKLLELSSYCSKLTGHELPLRENLELLGAKLSNSLSSIQTLADRAAALERNWKPSRERLAEVTTRCKDLVEEKKALEEGLPLLRQEQEDELNRLATKEKQLTFYHNRDREESRKTRLEQARQIEVLNKALKEARIEPEQQKKAHKDSIYRFYDPLSRAGVAARDRELDNIQRLEDSDTNGDMNLQHKLITYRGCVLADALLYTSRARHDYLGTEPRKDADLFYKRYGVYPEVVNHHQDDEILLEIVDWHFVMTGPMPPNMAEDRHTTLVTAFTTKFRSFLEKDEESYDDEEMKTPSSLRSELHKYYSPIAKAFGEPYQIDGA